MNTNRLCLIVFDAPFLCPSLETSALILRILENTEQNTPTKIGLSNGICIIFFLVKTDETVDERNSKSSNFDAIFAPLCVQVPIFITHSNNRKFNFESNELLFIPIC